MRYISFEFIYVGGDIAQLAFNRKCGDICCGDKSGKVAAAARFCNIAYDRARRRLRNDIKLTHASADQISKHESFTRLEAHLTDNTSVSGDKEKRIVTTK
jgi:hypothetical protein